MRNIDWRRRAGPLRGRDQGRAAAAADAAGVRRHAGASAPRRCRAMLDAGKPVQIIDARPRHYISRTQDIMEGAVWRDPERVQDWIGELSSREPVVIYCVYGFHIGCQTAIALREAGFEPLHERRPLRVEGDRRQGPPVRGWKPDVTPRRAFIGGALSLLAPPLHAQEGSRMTRIDFDSPVVFRPMLTGRGGPVAWRVIDDPTAPAGPKVLAEHAARTRPTTASRWRCSTSRCCRISTSRCGSSRSEARSTARPASRCASPTATTTTSCGPMRWRTTSACTRW